MISIKWLWFKCSKYFWVFNVEFLNHKSSHSNSTPRVKFDQKKIVTFMNSQTLHNSPFCWIGPVFRLKRWLINGLISGQIEPGDTVYRCRDCEAKPKVYLCSSCFEASIHVNCQNYEEFTASRNQKYRCHCGLRDSWCHQVNILLSTWILTNGQIRSL